MAVNMRTTASRVATRPARAMVAKPLSLRPLGPLRAQPEDNIQKETPAPDVTKLYGGKVVEPSELNKAPSEAQPVQPTNYVAQQNLKAAQEAATFPSFTEVMGFAGSPEIINGRLAMLGFVAAMGAEIASGHTVFRQLQEEPTGVVLTFLLFIAASLAPAFFRKRKDQKPLSFGPFTPMAELWNGRAAMIGFAALLIIEAASRHAYFA